MNKQQIKLTFDTDTGRVNLSPTIVVTDTGRRILFYEKLFTSGLTTYSPINEHISQTPPFTVNVPAGSGTINGSPVSWSAGSGVLSPDTFVLVRVDSSGALHFDSSWNMATVASSIVLAYVNVGNSAIVYVDEVEKIGRYIYVRKQEQYGGDWVWTDEEFVVNTGEKPYAFFDASSNKVYLMYKKDSASYCRVFDLTDETTTWRYIPNTFIDVGIIHLNRDPQTESRLSFGQGIKSQEAILDIDLFPLSTTGLSFRDIGGGIFKPFVFLPFLTGSYLSYLQYPYTIEVGRIENGLFVTEYSEEFTDNYFYSPNRWRQWIGTLGLKYFRVKCQSLLLVGDWYTPSFGYRQVLVFDPFENRTVDGDRINSDLIKEPAVLKSASGYKSLIIKTSELEEIRDTEQDIVPLKNGGAGLFSSVVKTSEFEEIRDTEQDTIGAFSFSSGRISSVVITNV